MDEESESFVVYLTAFKALLAEIMIHFLWEAQILALIQAQVPTKVPSKYADYADVFFFDLAMQLLENTGINKYAIKLEKGKPLLYRLIYSLGLIELETLKTYIEIRVKIGFI